MDHRWRDTLFSLDSFTTCHNIIFKLCLQRATVKLIRLCETVYFLLSQDTSKERPCQSQLSSFYT